MHDFVFFVPELQSESEGAELTGDEHHHVSKVLRMSPGEVVFATNGAGLIVRCVIEGIDRGATRLSVDDVIEDQPAGSGLILALAVLKKEAFELAVKQCSELGVTHFTPFVADKSHLKKYSQTYLERLRRIALSAMKQSFRSVLPTIDGPLSFEALLARVADCGSVVVGDADAPLLAGTIVPRPDLIVVGPEGGLTDTEYRQLDEAGCRRVAVSAKRLRSETAAAVFASFAGLPG
jgi:16S rRNA (uracil1498-N3)-methyltransferase